MPNDLEKAIHGLVKIVVQEVVSDLQSRGLLVNPITSEQDSDSDDRFLLRAKEVAERLAISDRHLHKMTVEGVIPCVRIGQSVRYRAEAVQDWLREAESTEAPQPRKQASVKKKSIKTKEAKIPRKSQHNIVKKQTVTNTKKPEKVSNQKKGPKKKSGPKRTNPEPEQERTNPFRLLLKEIGVDRDTIGPVTFGELRQIAEVDIPVFHGWMYLGQGMPEEALEKLRMHFSKTI
ncbi:MAG: hypothetical protein CME33_17710 [Gimesia sp.]|uniref:helix-turn-helix domain-containing protein n=1 Tax=Gimesia sp. TaxID=2024833 RepID=UPI000C609208|nr:helix-turn-helix domain-containing protein [Gimesia sp.]MAX38394.1 hypothetical protein [Gimesia sp.]|tara:strand:+ start:26103 stop:26801 length:699 start_codon:yes stop_codon:yes gene_type:complete